MKIKIYFFGKKNEITDWEIEYLKRIKFRAECEIIALPQAGITEAKKAKEIEGESLLKKLPEKAFLIALDENGKSYDSVQFSGWMKKQIETFQFLLEAEKENINTSDRLSAFMEKEIPPHIISLFQSIITKFSKFEEGISPDTDKKNKEFKLSGLAQWMIYSLITIKNAEIPEEILATPLVKEAWDLTYNFRDLSKKNLFTSLELV